MSGILANSSTKTMVSGDTTPDNAVTGYVTQDEISLSVTGTPSSTVWALAKPAAETAACQLSSATDPNPKFTATAEGYFTVTCVVDGTTTYVIRIAVARVGAVSTLTAVRLVPILNASVPTPATGRTVFSSIDLADLAQKLPDGLTYPLAGGGGGTGSGAYPTVAALKAITSTILASLDDGVSLAYVTPLRSWFVWEASSTVADDTSDFLSVAVTANGVAAGRFRRLDWAHPSWRTQTAWFVSTAGSNENDGLTSGTPVLSDVEIQRRWGLGQRVRLSVAVTITYAQSPTTPTNFNIECAATGSLKLVGTPTVTKAGTVLTAVQAQVRTVGAELAWAITAVGLGAADVGKIAVITASGTGGNVGAYAAVLKDETGGKVRVSPFITFNGTVLATTTAVTPLVGDTIEIRDMSPTTITVGTIEVHSATDDPGSSSATGFLMFDSVRVSGNSTTFAGCIFNGRIGIFYVRCDYFAIRLAGLPSSLALGIHRLCGGVSNSTIVFGFGSNSTITSVGFLASTSHGTASRTIYGTDSYFQNCGINIAAANGGIVLSNGNAFFDRSVSDATIVINGGNFYLQQGAVPDWGAANAGHAVKVAACAAYTYTTKPTINRGLGPGREALIGGTDKLYTAVPYVEPTNNAALVFNDTTTPTDGPVNYYQTYANVAALKALTATRLANLQDGQRVYVATLLDWFAWDAASTVADDTTDFMSVAVTANGASAGRFRRLGEGHPSAMDQLTWCVDGTLGSNENTGLDAASALKTTEERRRRMGPNPQWLNSAYHLRYLTDNLADIIAGQCPYGTTTVIYVHGSMTDRAGATTLLAGALTAVTALATATNIPWSSTSADVPVSWTASGLVDKRIRLTSGANVGALAWVTKDNGGAAPAASARFSEFMTPAAGFTAAPFVTPTNASAGPSSGDTFVVETLRVISRIHLDINAGPRNSPSATKVVFDSVDVGISGGETCGFYIDGCRVTTQRSHMQFYTAHNCQWVNCLDLAMFKTIVGGYSPTASFIVEWSGAGPFTFDFWTVQGSKQILISGHGTAASPDAVRINRFGMYDSTISGIAVVMPYGVRLAAGWVMYGSGNSGTLITLAGNCSLIYQAGQFTAPPIVTSSTPHFTFSTRTTSFPFDQAAAPPQYKAAIDLTFANIIATVASGGFGDTDFVCPATGCQLVRF